MSELHDKQLAAVQEALRIEDNSPLSECLGDIRSEDIAEFIDLLDPPDRERVMIALGDQNAGEVLSQVDDAVRAELLEDLPKETITDAVATLPPDDAADVLADLSDAQSEDVLKQISPEQAAEIRPLLEYHEETAGGVMTPDVLAVSAETTVQDAVNQLRQAQHDPQHVDDFFRVFVTGSDGELRGSVSINRLITAPPGTPITDIMDPDIAAALVHEDQEQVLNTLRRYDLVSIPVVDTAGKLVGRITHDDLMDVAAEEAEEDMFRMAGTDPDELDTASIFAAARIRATWLLPCMLGTMISAFILATFGQVGLAALIPFVPMIMAMGGNSGIQSSTVIVSGLARGDFALSHLFPVFLKEIRIALILAVVCALAASVVVPFAIQVMHVESVDTIVVPRIVLAVGLGMFLAILSAVTLGAVLPFAFRRVGIDPAIASGPFITTFNDIVGLAIYLAVGFLVIP
jgi:magnesium transporter